MEKGIAVTVATGRTFSSALPYIRKLNIRIPVITCNGAAIINPETEEVIFVKNLTADTVLTAVSSAELFNAEPILYRDSLRSDPYILKKTDTVTAFLHKEGLNRVITGSMDEVVNTSMKAVKLQIVGNTGQLISYKNRILSSVKNISVVMTKPDYLEIMPAGVSKGSAAEHLCKILNIPPDRVMSFGDSYNDRELLTFAKVGVAMADAPEELKSCAEITTDSISSVLDLIIDGTRNYTV